MKTKTIRQKIEFHTGPSTVFEALMDSKKHSAFTGGKAKIGQKAGEKFSAYDGYITGENIQIVAGKKIVQSWHASDWPEGHFSKATFELKKTKNGTMLSFTQTNVPLEFFEDISSGWHEHYWEKMKEFFGRQKLQV